jgi:hypothetical protein
MENVDTQDINWNNMFDEMMYGGSGLDGPLINVNNGSNDNDKATMTQEQIAQSKANAAANAELLKPITDAIKPITDFAGGIKDTAANVMDTVSNNYGKLAVLALIGGTLFTAYYGLKAVNEVITGVKTVKGKA